MTRRRRRKGRREVQHGRPTLLTEDVYEQLLELIAVRGNRLTLAAESLGLKANTVLGWYRKGKESIREPFHSFAKGVDQAKAQYRVKARRVVDDMAPEHPALAKWQLEKADPEGFGPTREEGPEVALPVPQQQTTVIVLTPDEIRTMARRRIAEERGDGDGDGAPDDRLKVLGTDISGTRTD